MSKFASVIFLALISSCVLAQGSSIPFKIPANSNKVSMGNCHMNYCSWSKPVSIRTIQKSQEQAIVEVALLGGESSHKKGKYPNSDKGVRIVWNKKPHTIAITCSYKHPSVSMDGQVDELPLGPNGVPNVLVSAANLYFEYCHSYDGDGSEKFGYNVEE